MFTFSANSNADHISIFCQSNEISNKETLDLLDYPRRLHYISEPTFVPLVR